MERWIRTLDLTHMTLKYYPLHHKETEKLAILGKNLVPEIWLK